jgi:hypothetical protein
MIRGAMAQPHPQDKARHRGDSDAPTIGYELCKAMVADLRHQA